MKKDVVFVSIFAIALFAALAAAAAPAVTNATVSPAHPLAGDDLSCSWVVTDADAGQSLFANVSWWRNSSGSVTLESAWGVNNIACTNATACATTLNVSGSSTIPADRWVCSVSAFDNGGEAAPQVNASNRINFQAVLNPDFDTYVEDAANASHGGEAHVLVKNSTSYRMALVHFDFTPVPPEALVTNATLVMWFNGSASDAPTAVVAVHNATATWAENASWNYSGYADWQGPSYGAAAADTVGSISTASMFKAWNVTSIAAFWTDASANNGLLLRSLSTSGTSKAFTSREGPAGYWPWLEVRFESGNVVPNPAAITVNNSGPLLGEPVLHSVLWKDYTGNLSGFVFSSNYSGAWQNGSWQPLGGNANWSNCSRQVNSTAIGNYSWRVYANDTLGAWNATPEQTMAVSLNTPPSVSSQAASPPVVVEGMGFNCSWTVTDPNAAQPLTANVSWWLNRSGVLTGQPSYSESNISCGHSTACTTRSGIPAGQAREGDYWLCSVAVTDGTAAALSNASLPIYFTRFFTAARDTYVENVSNSTHNAEYELKTLANSTNAFRSLVGFDLSDVPPQASVAGALAYFYLNSSSGVSSTAIAAFNVTSQWAENASWNHSGYAAWDGGAQAGILGSSLDSRSVGGTAGYYSWNATAAAAGWPGRPSNGVVLASQSGNNVFKDFDSREHGATPPYLAINFTCGNTAPAWGSASANSTPVLGEVVLHSVLWKDYTGNLSGSIFSSNYSGAWQNGSWQPLAGNVNWSNYSRQVNSTAVGTYAWRVYANDTLGAWNSTAEQAMAISTNTAPSVGNVSALPNPANDTTDLNCSWVVTDVDEGQVLRANVTWWRGSNRVAAFDSTVQCANATACYAGTAVSSANTTPGDNWHCVVTGYDGWGGSNSENATTTITYIVNITAGADTYIDNATNASHASGPLLNLSKSGLEEDRILVAFNVSRLASYRLLSAFLQLYYNSSESTGPSARTVALHNVTSPWLENASWNYSGYAPWNGGSFGPAIENKTIGGLEGYAYSWNATNETLGWLMGSSNGLLLEITNSSGGPKKYNSHESGTNPPVLQVEYVDRAPTVSAVLATRNPIPGEAVNCSWVATDGESAVLQANVSWWNGTTLAGSANSSTQCANATTCYAPVPLGGGNTSVEETWTCRVDVFDSSGGSDYSTSATHVNRVALVPASLDAWIGEASPDAANSTGEWLELNASAGKRARALLMFPFGNTVPINSTVTNATLRIFASRPAGLNASAHAAAQSWDGQATWNNRSASAAWSSAGGDFNSTAMDSKNITASGNYSLDVTGAAASWVNSTLNKGILLKFADEGGGNGTSFASLENGGANSRPVLEVRFYETPNSPPSVQSVAITPQSPNTTDDINCSWTVTDAEDSSLLANVSWWNGTAEVQALASATYCINATTCNAPVGVPASLTAKGEQWKCAVTATDSLGKSSSANSTAATILNSPPSVPTALGPLAGTYDVNVTINCNGSSDADGDAVSYAIDANDSGQWHALAYGDADGVFTWDTNYVSAQSGIALRCNASDGTNSSAYLEAGSIGINHTIFFTSRTQSSAAQAGGDYVNWTVNASGTGSVLCNYSFLPPERVGSLEVINQSDAANVAISNSTTAVWWNCSLTADNYTILFQTPPPNSTAAWFQNNSRISTFSAQYAYAVVNVTNPSSVAYSNVGWNATCITGFSCSATGGTIASVAALGYSTATVDGQGDGISESFSPVAQNASPAAPANLSLQKAYSFVWANSTVGIALSNVYTGVRVPPAQCWQADSSDDSPSAFLTVQNGSNGYGDDVWWLGDCVNETLGGWQAQANLSFQNISRQLNLSNDAGIPLNVTWTAGSLSSCWAPSYLTDYAAMEAAGSAAITANASGDCLNETTGEWGQDLNFTTAANGTAYVRRLLQVDNLAGVNFTNVTGFNATLFTRAGWNCSRPDAVNVTQDGYANASFATCSKSAVVTMARGSRGQDPTFETSIGGAAYSRRPLTLNNSDGAVNYSAVFWQDAPDAGWTGNQTNGTAAVPAGSNATAYLTQYDNASDVIASSNSTGFYGKEWNFTLTADDVDSISYYNVTFNYSIYDPPVGTIAMLAVKNDSSYESIMPSATSTLCDGAAPAYESFTVNGSVWRACAKDRNGNGFTDFVKVLIPSFELSSTAERVIAVGGNDTIAPTAYAGSPDSAEGPNFTVYVLSNEAAACRASAGTDSDYDSMGINFSGDNTNVHAANVTASEGNATLYVRCADRNGNKASSSYSFGVVVTVCGNKACGYGESCSTCPADCGACAGSTPTPPGGGPSGGSYSGGGSVELSTPVPKATPVPTPAQLPIPPAPTPKAVGKNATANESAPEANPDNASDEELMQIARTEITKAEVAVEGARRAGADVSKAQQMLDKARDEFGKGRYRNAIEYARRSQGLAEIAIAEAMRRKNDGSALWNFLALLAFAAALAATGVIYNMARPDVERLRRRAQMEWYLLGIRGIRIPLPELLISIRKLKLPQLYVGYAVVERPSPKLGLLQTARELGERPFAWRLKFAVEDALDKFVDAVDWVRGKAGELAKRRRDKEIPLEELPPTWDEVKGKYGRLSWEKAEK